MPGFFTSIFTYTFLWHALLASLLSSILFGVAGTYVVTRRMVFLTGGVTHASFGGLGLAFFLGFNPGWGAMLFCILAAIGVEYFTQKGNLRNDSAIAILWAGGTALGILFIYLTPGYAPSLMAYLFGSILTVTRTDIFTMGIASALVLAGYLLVYRQIIVVAFDESWARSMRMPVGIINYGMMVVVAVVIVIGIKSAGILLVVSLMSLPQAIAGLFFVQYNGVVFGSMVVSFLAMVSGIALSYYLNLPSGASIILVLSVLYGLLRLVRWLLPSPIRYRMFL